MAYLPSQKDHVGKTWPNPLEWNDQRVHWLADAEKTRDFYQQLRKRYQNSAVFAQTTYQADYGRRLPLGSNQNSNYNDLKFKFGRNAAFSSPTSSRHGTNPMPPVATYNVEQLKNCPQLDFLRCSNEQRSQRMAEPTDFMMQNRTTPTGCENVAKNCNRDNGKFPSLLQHYNRKEDTNSASSSNIPCRRCCCCCCCCGNDKQNFVCGGNSEQKTTNFERQPLFTYNPTLGGCTDSSRPPPYSSDIPMYSNCTTNTLKQSSRRPTTTLDDRVAADNYYDYTTTTTTRGGGTGNGDSPWTANNNIIPPRYKTLLVCDNAERLRAKSNLLCEHETEAAKMNQSDVERQLADRVTDTNFWRSELRNESNEMFMEMSKLRNMRQQLEARMRELDGPLSTNAECQVMRQKLKLATGDNRNNNGEQVDKDRADQEMQAEYNMLSRYQQRLGALTRNLNDKLQQEEQIYRELEADGVDKSDAMAIDRHCQRMQPNSPEVQRGRGQRGTPAGGYMSNPQSWVENSERKLRLARSLRSDSQKQRIEAERLLSEMSKELIAQCHAVNDELLKKSIFNEQRKMRVREQYTKTCMRINDMERDVEMLARVLNSRNSPLALAQTRAAARTARPNMDLCNDQVEHKLRNEISALQASTQRLNDQMRAVQYSLAELRTVKAGMETEMLNAATNVYVDREKCLGMRKQYPVLFRAGMPNV